MTPEQREIRGPLWPHILTAALTLLIQLVLASYVYGQLSALVTIHSKEIDNLQREKLDAAIYYREHPTAPKNGDSTP